MLLAERVAIVTGAGSGIGRAIAVRLAQEGAWIAVAEINPESGKAAASEIAERGGRAEFVETNVAEIDSLQNMVQKTVETFGRLDILVNNAGIDFRKSVLETTLEDWESVIDTDLRGTFFGCKFAAEQFIRQQSAGCIVNISSVHSIATLSGAGPYAAAKGGVNQLTKALANELGVHNIRVNAVCPGLINTQIWQDIKDSEAKDTEQLVKFWRSNIALRREGEPSEIAELVTWLCTDQASYLTGAHLMIDGGMTAMLVPHQD